MANKATTLFNLRERFSTKEIIWSWFVVTVSMLCLTLIATNSDTPVRKIISPLIASISPLHPLQKDEQKVGNEVFGFLPWWNKNKTDTIDFQTLTTFAYFGVEINENGEVVTDDPGYTTFHSEQMTNVFKKAHENGTSVVLTITQMKNAKIEALLDNPQAQDRAIDNTIALVRDRGIDGVNIDMEYAGNPGSVYQAKFSDFVEKLTNRMHSELPGSKVSISVYASAAKGKTLYDIERIGRITDKVFMMAYDFAVAGSDVAVPTAPLYGHKEGVYGYDIATAVEDFSKKMPAEKIVLGVPYYGYDYVIYGNPQFKASTRPMWGWRGRSNAKTYKYAMDNLGTEKSGWDDYGKVSWKAYYVAETDTWRMMYLDDEKSLGMKYDFAKSKNLAGVGMWALGNDEGRPELWNVLREKFGGTKLVDSRIVSREIKGGI